MKQFFKGQPITGIRWELIELLISCDKTAQSPFDFERDAANAAWIAARKHMSLAESLAYDEVSFVLHSRIIPDFMVREALADVHLN
jgi:hypothetical protein